MLTGLFSTLYCVCCLFLAGFAHDSGKPPRTSTKEARLTATVLDQEETIEVSIDYIINKSSGSSHISYIGLEAFDTQIENIKATFNSTNVSLIPDTDHLKIAGHIALPESIVNDTTFNLTLSYTLLNARHRGGDNFDINIPLLWIENSSPASNKSFFEAHLIMPDGYYIKESFPANVGPCRKANSPGHSCINLQVLPTFLRIRGIVGHNPIFTAVKVLDYSILVLLAVTCLFIGIQLTKKQLSPVYNR